MNNSPLRVAAFAIIAGIFTVGVNAQSNTTLIRSQPALGEQPAASTTLIAANDMPDSVSYSSSAGAAETSDAENFITNPLHASMAMQPPPRRYGRRPVYADTRHNADGSPKYTFFGGAGFTLPTGGTHAYYDTSYDFQVGGGRNFNRKFALLAEFDWHNFGIQTGTLNTLLAEYQGLGATDGNGNALSVLGGHAHIWSFTLDPQYTFAQGDKVGAYVIGGAGFYHKITDFTVPTTGYYFDPYYGEIPYEANATLDSYVSNAFGVNGGVGVTYKPSRFGDVKFYGEARYVYTANSARSFYDGTGTNPSSNANYFDVFPQNSAKTTYIPVTFGVRF